MTEELKLDRSDMVVRKHGYVNYKEEEIEHKILVEDADRELFIRFVNLIHRGRAFDPQRPVTIDGYHSSYGLTGYVICVQGTPNRGTLIVDLERKFAMVLPFGTWKEPRTTYIKDWEQEEKWELVINFLKIADACMHVGHYKYVPHRTVGLPEAYDVFR